MTHRTRQTAKVNINSNGGNVNKNLHLDSGERSKNVTGKSESSSSQYSTLNVPSKRESQVAARSQLSSDLSSLEQMLDSVRQDDSTKSLLSYIKQLRLSMQFASDFSSIPSSLGPLCDLFEVKITSDIITTLNTLGAQIKKLKGNDEIPSLVEKYMAQRTRLPKTPTADPLKESDLVSIVSSSPDESSFESSQMLKDIIIAAAAVRGNPRTTPTKQTAVLDSSELNVAGRHYLESVMAAELQVAQWRSKEPENWRRVYEARYQEMLDSLHKEALTLLEAQGVAYEEIYAKGSRRVLGFIITSDYDGSELNREAAKEERARGNISCYSPMFLLETPAGEGFYPGCSLLPHDALVLGSKSELSSHGHIHAVRHSMRQQGAEGLVFGTLRQASSGTITGLEGTVYERAADLSDLETYLLGNRRKLLALQAVAGTNSELAGSLLNQLSADAKTFHKLASCIHNTAALVGRSSEVRFETVCIDVQNSNNTTNKQLVVQAIAEINGVEVRLDLGPEERFPALMQGQTYEALCQSLLKEKTASLCKFCVEIINSTQGLILTPDHVSDLANDALRLSALSNKALATSNQAALHLWWRSAILLKQGEQAGGQRVSLRQSDRGRETVSKDEPVLALAQPQASGQPGGVPEDVLMLARRAAGENDQAVQAWAEIDQLLQQQDPRGLAVLQEIASSYKCTFELRQTIARKLAQLDDEVVARLFEQMILGSAPLKVPDPIKVTSAMLCLVNYVSVRKGKQPALTRLLSRLLESGLPEAAKSDALLILNRLAPENREEVKEAYVQAICKGRYPQIVRDAAKLIKNLNVCDLSFAQCKQMIDAVIHSGAANTSTCREVCKALEAQDVVKQAAFVPEIVSLLDKSEMPSKIFEAVLKIINWKSVDPTYRQSLISKLLPVLISTVKYKPDLPIVRDNEAHTKRMIAADAIAAIGDDGYSVLEQLVHGTDEECAQLSVMAIAGSLQIFNKKKEDAIKLVKEILTPKHDTEPEAYLAEEAIKALLDDKQNAPLFWAQIVKLVHNKQTRDAALQYLQQVPIPAQETAYVLFDRLADPSLFEMLARAESRAVSILEYTYILDGLCRCGDLDLQRLLSVSQLIRLQEHHETKQVGDAAERLLRNAVSQTGFAGAVAELIRREPSEEDRVLRNQKIALLGFSARHLAKLPLETVGNGSAQLVFSAILAAIEQNDPAVCIAAAGALPEFCSEKRRALDALHSLEAKLTVKSTNTDAGVQIAVNEQKARVRLAAACAALSISSTDQTAALAIEQLINAKEVTNAQREQVIKAAGQNLLFRKNIADIIVQQRQSESSEVREAVLEYLCQARRVGEPEFNDIRMSRELFQVAREKGGLHELKLAIELIGSFGAESAFLLPELSVILASNSDSELHSALHKSLKSIAEGLKDKPVQVTEAIAAQIKCKVEHTSPASVIASASVISCLPKSSESELAINELMKYLAPNQKIAHRTAAVRGFCHANPELMQKYPAQAIELTEVLRSLVYESKDSQSLDLAIAAAQCLGCSYFPETLKKEIAMSLLLAFQAAMHSSLRGTEELCEAIVKSAVSYANVSKRDDFFSHFAENLRLAVSGRSFGKNDNKRWSEKTACMFVQGIGGIGDHYKQQSAMAQNALRQALKSLSPEQQIIAEAIVTELTRLNDSNTVKEWLKTHREISPARRIELAEILLQRRLNFTEREALIEAYRLPADINVNQEGLNTAKKACLQKGFTGLNADTNIKNLLDIGLAG